MRNAVDGAACGALVNGPAVAGFCAAALIATASPALAQREAGPYAGIFNGQPTRDTAKWLDFHGSAGASYDQNLVDDPNGSVGALRDPRLWESGGSMGASGALVYLRRTDRSEGMLSASGSARKFSVSADIATAADVSGTFSRKMAPKLFVNTKGSARYSPFLAFVPFQGGELNDPSIEPAIDFGFAAVSDPNAYGDADIELVSRFTKRSEFAIGASARQWLFLDHPETNLYGYGGRASLRHNITRPLSVHIGYARDQVGYQSGGPDRLIPNDTIDAGVDYGDTLNFTRRTALSFATSTSAIHFEHQTHYRVNGNVGLTKGFGRTWQISGHYNRSSEFLPTYREPVLSDGVTANIGGMFTPRTRWSAAAGYTRATVGFDSPDDPAELIGWFSSSTTLSFAVTRYWAIAAQYRYYHYSAPTDEALLDFEPRLSRQVVTVALNVWIPILNVIRSTSDPR